MISVLLLLLLLGGLLLSGFFSGAETGIYCLNRVRLRVASEQGRRGAQRLERLMQQPEELVITMLLGTNIADYVITASSAALLLWAAVSPNLAEIYATAIGAPLVLVFGGIIPKDWFRREADRLMYRLALPVAICTGVARATGFIFVLRALTRFLIRRLDPEHLRAQEGLLPRARLLGMLREGAAHGGLSSLQRDLMDRVMKISHTPVSAVMIPLARTVHVSKSIGREDFLRIARMAHFSRLPVYDGAPDQLTGVINVYDVLTDEDERPIASYVRPGFRIPANLSVSAALLRLQRAREAMAIVQAYDGPAVGILTVKDLAAEIIGDFEAW